MPDKMELMVRSLRQRERNRAKMISTLMMIRVMIASSSDMTLLPRLTQMIDDCLANERDN